MDQKDGSSVDNHYVERVFLKSFESGKCETPWSPKKLEHLLRDLTAGSPELAESPASWIRLVSAVPHSLVVTDTVNRVRLTNNAAEDLFGPPASEDLWTWIRPTDPSRVGEIEDALGRSTTWRGEIEIRQADGKVLTCELIALAVANPGQPDAARLWIFEDTTDKHRRDVCTGQWQYLVTKGEMAGEIAHEINNHLAVLSGHAELLAMGLGDDLGERAQSRLKRIEQAIDRLKTFADGLLHCRNPIRQKKAIDVNSFLENQVVFLRPQKKIKKIMFETEWGAGLPRVVCNPCGLQQVFYNLVLNAAEAVEGANIKQCTVSVQTCFLARENRVSIIVADHGPGIVPDVLPKIFRERVSTKSPVRGFGLLTAADTVRDDGGTIEARNRPEGGAEFVVSLPVNA